MIRHSFRWKKELPCSKKPHPRSVSSRLLRFMFQGVFFEGVRGRPEFGHTCWTEGWGS